MIGVIDYGMSNLTCVVAAIERLGYSVTTSQDPAIVAASDKIILPGVGAFGDAMASLNKLGFSGALNEHVRDGGKPFLGICLGAQLICKNSDEHGECDGLGWANAVVREIQRVPTTLRVPHTGWDSVEGMASIPLFSDIPKDALFYYTHSHAIFPHDESMVVGTCSYGSPFASALSIGDNIFATQFHPEKSQKWGLALLDNFLVHC